MPIYLIKSYLSIIVIILSGFALFTMLEVFGREQKKYNIGTLKKLHRINGIIYIALFFVVSFLCIKVIFDSVAELSPRGTSHLVFALSVISLLAIKILFVRLYRQFYNQVKIIGITIALLTIGLVGTSGGYYLLITKFGMRLPVISKKETYITISNNPESIKRGRELYESKCYSCHDPESNKTIIGPGHKGILKNPYLPISKKPATPENILNQLRNPYQNMPRFDYLTDEEVIDIVSYLNTL